MWVRACARGSHFMPITHREPQAVKLVWKWMALMPRRTQCVMECVMGCRLPGPEPPCPCPYPSGPAGPVPCRKLPSPRPPPAAPTDLVHSSVVHLHQLWGGESAAAHRTGPVNGDNVDEGRKLKFEEKPKLLPQILRASATCHIPPGLDFSHLGCLQCRMPTPGCPPARPPAGRSQCGGQRLLVHLRPGGGACGDVQVV